MVSNTAEQNVSNACVAAYLVCVEPHLKVAEVEPVVEHLPVHEQGVLVLGLVAERVELAARVDQHLETHIYSR